MELKSKILVVGGGAIGGLFSWRLSLTHTLTVSVVCRSNYHQVKAQGYHIDSKQFGSTIYRPYRVYRSVEEAVRGNDGEAYDYVIVATKALPNILDSSQPIQPAVGPETMIMLFQNGIGIEPPFVARFPCNPLVSTVSFISVKQTAPGHLQHGGFSLLAAGIHHRGISQTSNQQLSQIMDGFQKQGGVRCVIESDIQPYRWQKHILNGSTNPVSVICGGSASCQEMVDNPHCRKLLEETMAEIILLGKKVTGKALPGVDGVVDPKTATDYIKSIPVPVYTSMLLDSQCKRPMERDVILKHPIELADKYNVDVPNLRALYALVTMIEEGYSK